jgi:hypothetical protein
MRDAGGMLCPEAIAVTSILKTWFRNSYRHMKVWKNERRPGTMAVLVSAPRPALRTFEDALEAAG